MAVLSSSKTTPAPHQVNSRSQMRQTNKTQTRTSPTVDSNRLATPQTKTIKGFRDVQIYSTQATQSITSKSARRGRCKSQEMVSARRTPLTGAKRGPRHRRNKSCHRRFKTSNLTRIRTQYRVAWYALPPKVGFPPNSLPLRLRKSCPPQVARK